MKHRISLLISDEAIEILENYAFFHDTTIDDIAEGAIQMFPFHERRTHQIQEFDR